MDHSDTYKPQGISAVSKIHYEDVDTIAKFDFPGMDTGAAYMYNIIDFDGSSVGRNNQPTIIGSHISWWNLGCDCQVHPVYKVWLCNKSEGREIGMLHVVIPGITRVSHTSKIKSLSLSFLFFSYYFILGLLYFG